MFRTISIGMIVDSPVVLKLHLEFGWRNHKRIVKFKSKFRVFYVKSYPCSFDTLQRDAESFGYVLQLQHHVDMGTYKFVDSTCHQDIGAMIAGSL